MTTEDNDSVGKIQECFSIHVHTQTDIVVVHAWKMDNKKKNEKTSLSKGRKVTSSE